MRATISADAGVVDVVLSNFARGYTNPDYIAQRIAPPVDVPARNIRVVKFGRDGFRKLNTRRAPGAPILTVQYGYATEPVVLAQDALQGLVPVESQEEAARAPGVDLGRHAVQMVLDQLDLGLEIDAAQLMRNPSHYAPSNKTALSGASRWSDPASNPKSDVKEAREAVRRAIGRYPNKLVLGADVFNALDEHPKILEQFKYTGGDSLTETMLARYLGVDEVVVGKAVYLPEGESDDAPAADVWGKDAILLYAPKTPSVFASDPNAPNSIGEGNWMVPSFAYTYRLKGYPNVETAWYDHDIRSWKYPTTQERRPYLVGADAGFLIQGAVA